MPMPSITLSYRFTEAEAKLAIRETTNSVVKIGKLMPWIGVGLMLSGIVSALALQLPPSNVSRQIGLGVVIAAFPLFTRWIAAQRARKLPNLNTTIRWEINTERLQTSSEKDSTEFSWDLVTKLEERPLGFLLFPQPQLAYWLPKRAFANEAAIDQFRALVESKAIPLKRLR